ncbi:MAG: MCE family protein [Rhodospirillales bacterium]|nr:MCE family protein [Rhodospirillales bacterium]
MSKPADPKMIGAFVLGAVALIVAGVLILGGGTFFARQTPAVMFFKGSVAGLSVGSSVNFRGVKVGQVTRVFIRYEPDGTSPLIIPVFAELSTDNIQLVGNGEERDPTHEVVRRGTDNTLRTFVERGLRAQLALPSLVTGQATISLDFFPTMPADFDNSYPDRIEIPTAPSTLQEVQATVQQVIDKVSQLPLDELVDDARNMLKGANRLVNDPQIAQAIANANLTMDDLRETAQILDARLGPLIASLHETSATAGDTLSALRGMVPHAETSLDQITATMKTAQQSLTAAEQVLTSANGVIEPGSAVNFALSNALKETAAAARSVRELVDQLQRDPNSLVFGRPAESNN